MVTCYMQPKHQPPIFLPGYTTSDYLGRVGVSHLHFSAMCLPAVFLLALTSGHEVHFYIFAPPGTTLII